MFNIIFRKIRIGEDFLKKIILQVESLLRKWLIVKLPDEYKNEFKDELLNINLSRQKKISIAFTIWNILMAIYLGLESKYGLWNRIPSYKYLFYIHCIFAFLFTFILFGINNKDKRIYIKNKIIDSRIIKNILNLGFIYLIVYWCSLSVLFNANQIMGYIIGMFFCSFIIFMRPIESLCIFASSYIVILVGAFIVDNPFLVKEQYLTSGLINLIGNLIISRIIYSFHVRDFINKKLIEKQDHIRGEFFANISHELRTPLNMIFCTVQTIELYFKNGINESNKEKINSYVKSTKQNCYRLIKLINNIIDITKIDSNYFALELGNNDIVKIVKDITFSTHDYIENIGIKLDFYTDLEKCIIVCDPDKIERIMLNLLSNAVKFTPKKGYIKVRIYENHESIFLSVKDTGIGISEDNLQLIFERFGQVDKSLSRNREGSGIGLSLVKSLVEMHNGKISVVSGLNKGSEFIVELPKVSQKVTEKNFIANTYDNKIELINIEFSDLYNN